MCAQIIRILHDEIIVEAREDIAGGIAVTMKKCMEGAFIEIFPEVSFVVKSEIRYTWGLAFQNLQNTRSKQLQTVEYHWSDMMKINCIARI